MAEPLRAKAQNLTQLATAYNVHISTMSKWLINIQMKEKGVRRESLIYTPAEVQTIYDKLGEP